MQFMKFNLFSNNTGWAGNKISSAIRLKYFKVYDGEDLLHNYIPCINDKCEIGLYDVVKGNFYGNSGSGSFTVRD